MVIGVPRRVATALARYGPYGGADDRWVVRRYSLGNARRAIPMSDALWQFSAIASSLEDHQIACGVVKHPVTHNWQTWFSLYGTDITCIFSTKRYGLAHSVRQMFVAELRAGCLMDSDRATAFMKDLQALDGSELIDPLPQTALETLARQIRRQYVQDRDNAIE